ncbi:MAG: hypothetical protein KC561_00610 [Myxococcales bacterium]|nr:hypothetical protein [Myxococcales bacterium]
MRCSGWTLAGAIVALLLGSTSANAQEQDLEGLSGPHMRVGSGRGLGPVEAFTRLRSYVVQFHDAFDADGSRLGGSTRLARVGLIWDISFGAGSDLEFGASLSGSYKKDVSSEEISFDRAALMARYAIWDGSDGDWLSVAFSFARAFTGSSDNRAELALLYGTGLSDTLAIDLQAGLGLDIHSASSYDYEAVVGVAPIWRPNDWFGWSIGVGGSVGGRDGQDDINWQVDASSRFGFRFGRNEIALGVAHTPLGALNSSETTYLLSWNLNWITDDGFLTLDNDGGPSPEPEEGVPPLDLGPSGEERLQDSDEAEPDPASQEPGDGVEEAEPSVEEPATEPEAPGDGDSQAPTDTAQDED